MKFLLTFVAVVAILTLAAVFQDWQSSAEGGSATGAPTTQGIEDMKDHPNQAYQQATFAAGCFWGVEANFRRVPGVVATEVGFTGGYIKNPTYREVCTDKTGHAEAVLVTFDPRLVSYPELLDIFWSCHDPTTKNRQGPDYGSQYRSVIFYHDDQQKTQAEESLKEVDQSGVFKRPIVTEIVAAGPFYKAEDYHQQYFEKMGSADSCHTGVAVVHTKLAALAAKARQESAKAPATTPATSPTASVNEFGELIHPAATCKPGEASACGTTYWKGMTDAEMRAKLTPEQYQIARQAGTERAFSGKYWNEHRPGVYYCAVCGQPLFSSDTKFDSGTGWPSFWKPITPNAVIVRTDKSHGMERTEVLCSRCQSHLGHVFDDGPGPTYKRYCMNSAVLDFHPGATELPPAMQPTAATQPVAK